MRIFYLNRIKDISGMSGTGRVADGIEFGDGHVALRWNTNTASTEIWDSIAQVEQIHGHEGATEIVFLEDDKDDEYVEDMPNIHELEKSLAVLGPHYFVEVDFGISPTIRLACDLIKSMYVSIDADNAGNKVALAEADDDENEARRISNRINAGLNLFTDWVKEQDGYLIESGGDEGLARVKKLDTKALKKFAKEYADLTGFTLTIGIGKKLSQATRARMLGKLKGKNRIEFWEGKKSSAKLEELMEHSPKNESEKIKEAGFFKAQGSAGAGTKGGQILGYTSSGKPIYASREEAKKRARESQQRKDKKQPQNALERRQKEKTEEAKGIRSKKESGPISGRPGSKQAPAGRAGNQANTQKELNGHLEALATNPGYIEAVLKEFLRRKLSKAKPVSQPGKRGGQVVGHDKQGNPIYASSQKVIGTVGHSRTPVYEESSHPEHKKFTGYQHREAAKLHHYMAGLYPKEHAKRAEHEMHRNAHLVDESSLARVKLNLPHPDEYKKISRPEGVNTQHEQEVIKEFLPKVTHKKAS